MHDSTPARSAPRPAPTIGLRIRVMERRSRFAALLSRLSGQSIDDAWRAFSPLPAPDGAWGIPDPEDQRADRDAGRAPQRNRAPAGRRAKEE